MTTVEPAAKVPLTLLGIVHDAQVRPARDSGPLPPELAGQAERLAREVGLDIPPPVMVRAMIAWTQLFGMLSFELFGHLVGSADPADAFFAHAVEQMAEFVGIPPAPAGGEPVAESI